MPALCVRAPAGYPGRLPVGDLRVGPARHFGDLGDPARAVGV
jgi:hypothetical protein